MLKNISQLEIKVVDKIYHFTCDIDSPLNHAKEALLKFLQYIGQIEDQVKMQQEAAEKEKQAQEQSKEEVKVPEEVA